MNDDDRDQLLSYLEKAKGKGINRVYLHWTAGRYDQVFDDYHICVKGDGVVWFSTDNLAETKAHTYKRNSNAIGIALCCAYNATATIDKNKKISFNLGEYPPTATQVENTAQIIALICQHLNIAININRIMTHAEAADNMDGVYAHEPYGPLNGCERWDLYQLRDYDGQWKSGGDVLRGKAVWYKLLEV